MDIGLERAFIEKARKEPEAFGKIFDEYYPKIFSYTLKRVVDIKVAEDITSEVFFKAFSKLWQFRWRNISFLCWIFKITHREIAYYFRTKKYKHFSLDDLIEKKVFTPIDKYDLQQEIIELEERLQKNCIFLDLHNSLQKLPSKYQEVIILRFFENKKVKEIAEILDKREGTIKSLISRGIQLLRKSIAANATF